MLRRLSLHKVNKIYGPVPFSPSYETGLSFFLSFFPFFCISFLFPLFLPRFVSSHSSSSDLILFLLLYFSLSSSFFRPWLFFFYTENSLTDFFGGVPMKLIGLYGERQREGVGSSPSARLQKGLYSAARNSKRSRKMKTIDEEMNE